MVNLHPQVYEQLLKKFRGTGALVENGHFVYRSGKHGDAYIDHWKLLRDTKTMHHFCRILAERFTDPDDKIDVVAGPERGGGYVAMWVAYHLSLMRGVQIPWFFISKNEEENFHYLDEKFVPELAAKRALFVDDVINTGSGILEAIDLIREIDGIPVGVAALANRGLVSASYFPFVQKFTALFTLPLISWSPSECPLCKAGVPISMTLGHGKREAAQESASLSNREWLECSDWE